MKKILIVDDNHIERDIFKRHLRKDPQLAGVEYLEAINLAEAEEHLKSDEVHKIKLIVLDHNLPDGTASELLSFMKGHEILLPVLVVTGSNDPKVAAEVIKMGAHEYINKEELSPGSVSKAVASAINSFKSSENEKSYYRDLKSFASRLAQDLKEPIASILGLVELLKDDPDDQQLLDLIAERAHFSSDLIDQMSHFTLTRKMASSVFPAEDIVREVLDEIRGNGHEVDASIAPLPTMCGDSGLVKVLFQNLISNAIKYRKPDVDLKLKIYLEDSKIVVEDNGIGFSAEDSEKIFNPLTRLKQNEAEGYGLGLSTCQRIASIHGGNVSATSEAGKGSKFYIDLPKQNLERAV